MCVQVNFRNSERVDGESLSDRSLQNVSKSGVSDTAIEVAPSTFKLV